MNSSLEKAKELLSQLEPKEGLPEEMHGMRFGKSLENFITLNIDPEYNERKNEYLIERCRRAESLIIPDAANRVREVILAAMDSQCDQSISFQVNQPDTSDAEKIRALCAHKDNRDIFEELNVVPGKDKSEWLHEAIEAQRLK